MIKCIIVGCENEIGEKSVHEVCSPCRNRLKFWENKRPAERLARRVRLEVWQNRMDMIDTKVVPISRKKRA